MIIVTGLISSGKSTLLSKLNTLGFSVFNADLFVQNLYHDRDFVNEINNSKWNFLIENSSVSKTKILNLLNNNYQDFKVFEELVHLKVFKHLQDNEYDYAEIPVLKNSQVPFWSLAEQIIVLNLKQPIRIAYALKRGMDLRRFNQLDTINTLEFLHQLPFKSIKQIWLSSSEEISDFLAKLQPKNS